MAENQTLNTEYSIALWTRFLPPLACSLLLFMPGPAANTATLTLGWDPLDDPSVAGYVLHYGGVSGQYTNAVFVPTGSSVTVRRLSANTTYYFSVTSYDAAGTESPYSNEISWFITPPVKVTRNGVGTVFTQASATADPDINTYTIVAQPSAGMVFAGWTGSVTSSAARLSFVWSSNVVLQANFIPNPFPAAQGVYNGLFISTGQLDAASYGAFSLSVTRLGGYSGRVQISGVRYSFSGRFDAQCRATSIFTHSRNRPMVVGLELRTAEKAISGTLTDGDWLAELSGERAVFDAANNPAPYAGSYTLAFPGADSDPSIPEGDGFGTVRVFRSGLAVFSGTLADGTRVSQTTIVSASDRWPLCAPLYGGDGVLAGWPDFNNLASSADFGPVTWIKPANPLAQFYADGFTNQFEALGSAYVAPTGPNGRILPLANGNIAFTAGNLDSDFTNSVAITAHGRASDLSSNGLSMTISPGTGVFRGTVADPASAQRFVFNGAVLQNLDAGFGFLLGTNLSSRVSIGP